MKEHPHATALQAGLAPGQVRRGLRLLRPAMTAFEEFIVSLGHISGAMNSIRLRWWAIHDGILREPFTNVTMYKRVGKSAGINTTLGSEW